MYVGCPESVQEFAHESVRGSVRDLVHESAHESMRRSAYDSVRRSVYDLMLEAGSESRFGMLVSARIGEQWARKPVRAQTEPIGAQSALTLRYFPRGS